MALDLPNLVQLDVSVLSGLLAQELLKTTPDNISKMFFCNSGTEAVEAAIKFARFTTKREKIVYCEHGYHGLTMGALSLNGEEIFREGFGPLIPGCSAVPFNDLAALERALSNKDVAAFIVEPIQGKGLIYRMTVIFRRSSGFVLNTVRVGRRRGANWIGTHRQVLGNRPLGHQTGHDLHGESLIGWACPGRRSRHDPKDHGHGL